MIQVASPVTQPLNSFTPGFLKWTHQAVHLCYSTDQKRGVLQISKAEWQNSIDPDEMAYYDICCLQISVKASLGMNELRCLRA